MNRTHLAGNFGETDDGGERRRFQRLPWKQKRSPLTEEHGVRNVFLQEDIDTLADRCPRCPKILAQRVENLTNRMDTSSVAWSRSRCISESSRLPHATFARPKFPEGASLTTGAGVYRIWCRRPKSTQLINQPILRHSELADRALPLRSPQEPFEARE